MGQRTREITLGENTYTVVAQRHAYLERRLGPQFAEAVSLVSGGASQLIASGSEGYHGILSIFIPDLMPLWEWRGFGSLSAYEQTTLWKTTDGSQGTDQYDERQDKSPDLDQMVEAFEAVSEVNRIDMLGKLKELAGPDFFGSRLWTALRARVEVEGIRLLTNLPPGDKPSPSSPQSNGVSDQTSGGTLPPTSESSEGGPTPASPTT